MDCEKTVFFGEFCLDGDNACVWRASQPLSLTPKAFMVLQYLVEHAGRLVTKQELLASVWAGTCVGDAVLKVNIRAIRQVLQDHPMTPRFIETVHRRGYRFIGRHYASPFVK
jgi:DNA-binding winged helix-turn-helix (wHTH) protein